MVLGSDQNLPILIELVVIFIHSHKFEGQLLIEQDLVQVEDGTFSIN